MNTNYQTIRNLSFTVAAIAVAIQINAHSVYFEPNDQGQLIARFGEFGDDPETSPGYLDSLDTPSAWTSRGQGKLEAVALEKKEDHFTTKLSEQHDAFIQSGFPIMTRGSSPARKPHFYARWTRSFKDAAQPAMTLDIVPTGKPGEVRIFFRNQPLAGVELTLYTPEANDQDLESDENGFVRFASDEKGLFMLKIGRFREERTGFDRGLLFKLVSHNCSLTWIQK
jgi:hypothetical protein